ncbi:bifunctional phosphoribosyl-AMP cyclohydrolase/phosphoribosyl-ATP diphosphatase HisIE [Chloroflexus sp.]|uniref:bifunctional phosphoribosyl-AMP cyclohydrolase/phosphoribosyl-ATP diphosphatase HisIE n=1 Tax=Chloroflexus sp. TaxID=1904827 RepID=UPI00261564B4|nr:bifunctional phosphoribosyl-AMP cyclohydrolase/phosphoribosyl-ATP diphosphatase HisIE [uncultured Chloroflexus sp.]
MRNDELLPAIVQHARSGEVLMLGYMNEAALAATRESGFVTFYSRSRQRLWRKGETSGHTLRVVEIRQDCDGDALLILAEPAGPTCHTGRPSCFFRDLDDAEVSGKAPPVAVLARLADRIHARRDAAPTESYTAKLLHGGVDRIGKKIGEEAAEVIIAAKNGNPAEIVYELADLMYHSLVLLEQQGVAPEAVWAELARRYAAS